jgi:PEP-CTERM motif
MGTPLSGTQYFGNYYGPGATGDFFQVAVATQGGMANSLYLVMGNGAGTGYPKFRSASQQVQMDVSFDTTGLPSGISSSELTLLDVDNGDSTSTPSWRDEIQMLNAGGMFTPINPANYNFIGSPPTVTQNLGVGNTPSTSNASNITGFFAPATNSMSFIFRPGVGDALTAGNQLVGVNNIGLNTGVAAPEPGTLALIAVGGMGFASRLRRRKIDNAD